MISTRQHQQICLTSNTKYDAERSIWSTECLSSVNSRLPHDLLGRVSSEVNKSVLGSMLRKLFLSKVNFELDRALCGCQTTLDAAFKPFARKQQVYLATPSLSFCRNVNSRLTQGLGILPGQNASFVMHALLAMLHDTI